MNEHESILTDVNKALDMVIDLCKPKGVKGSREWLMSIPAEPDHDPDLVIGDALQRCRNYFSTSSDRIEELENLLKYRDGGTHDTDCKIHYDTGRCTCGHDAVNKALKKVDDENNA